MPLGRSNSKTHRIGAQAEDAALNYLREQGLTLVAQNWHQQGVGEVDLILLDGQTLVFVEVRQRQSRQYGGAAASVTRVKQQKIIQTAQCFLAANDLFAAHDCRFDVVAVVKQGEQLRCEWIPAAFML